MSNQIISNAQVYFNPILLGCYDFTVYRFVSRFIWGCKNEILLQRYRQFVQTKHLEVGVGTGYLIEKSIKGHQKENMRLTLMDLSVACLDKASKRLEKFNPSKIRHNILDAPIKSGQHKEAKQFNSIGINYVLHCVNGDFKEKGIAFGNLKKLLNENGVLFGSTVIANKQSLIVAKLFMRILNVIGLFNNNNDKVNDLEVALNTHFKFVKVRVVSSVVMFVASDCEV